MKKRNLFVLIILTAIALWGCNKTKENNKTIENNTTEATKSQEDLAELEKNINSVDFWLDKEKDPLGIVRNLEDIQICNKNMLVSWGTDWTKGYYDVTEVPESVEGKWLKDRITMLNIRDSKYYTDGELITGAQWDKYYDNMALDTIGNYVDARYGIIIKNAPAFDLPTRDIMTDEGLDEEFNEIQQTTLKINEPIVVLHTSKDGMWYYIVSGEFIGWVEKECCAVFEDIDRWKEYIEKENFLIATDDIYLQQLDQDIYMGTKLYLDAGKASDNEDKQDILVPRANDEGVIFFEVATVDMSSLNKGYLPFTRDNILRLAFSRLGDVYGWGGKDSKRDCSAYLKDIYSCFGFMLPRNSRLQMSAPGLATDMTDKSEAEKAELVSQLKAGDLLGISGHVMMYLGSIEGKHYVISMLSSYIPEEIEADFGNHILTPNCVMVNSLEVKRKNGNTWLQELTGIIKN